MNLPNKLTFLRVALIPLIVLMLSLTPEWCRWTALGLFVIASLTDYLDGHIARKNNLITDLGKFLDPLADKLLTLSVFIMMIQTGQMPAWIVILILGRELAVDGLRMVAVRTGKVISAGMAGKIKTTSQMILILYMIAFKAFVPADLPALIMTVWVIGITLYSGIVYFVKNKDIF